ncbi:LacI family DNA-binding transcriptional regulator [Paenibacillus piri]|uniref:LacI family transcriptional regulator n=1 Tax=Paenibacillus piri TaxID=2547395 RepID=A0A4R5K7Z7_9BACL|nr:LacI family DNA-binding transcriptional regulator [Paenibacillus piri]TDF88913.1 LacI family transcriptional regulator [Paenibacillus piri]
MKKRVTLEHIAQAVGVSKMAVSLAMRGDRSIGRETAEKIKATAREMGYVPNRMAQNLVKGKSHTIALLISAPLHDDYQNQIISGAVPYAMKRGYTLFVAPMSHHEMEGAYIEKYNHMMVDGFLAFHSLNSVNYRKLKQEGVPFVLYTKYFHDLDCDYVVGDDFQGGFRMTRHLIGLGHTNIGFVYDGRLRQSSEIAERIRGFRHALKKSGIPYSDDLLLPFELHYHAEEMTAAHLLRTNPEFTERMSLASRPTALFVCNDITASSVYLALKRLGLNIPEDVSVGGYEGVYLGSIMDPELTTVATPIADMGRKACELLIDKIEGKVAPNETVHIKLEPQLVIRHSTATFGSRTPNRIPFP